MIELDGSFGEGGGQILRSSLALSILTGQAFHLRKVRARRAQPGLRPQHLMSVRAAAAISQAETRGASLGSSDLVFEPGEVSPSKYTFAIGTAGATGLVLQTVYLPLALRTQRATELILLGGTHVNMSPCFDFLDTTWRAYLAHLGLRVNLRMRRPGFYPRGGGVVEARIEPCTAPGPLNLLDCGEVRRATGLSAVARLPEEIARRQRKRALWRLEQLGLKADIEEATWQGGPGTVLTVTLETRPAPTLFFGLGARGKPAERVADEAVDQVAEYLETQPPAVDPHSADQLALPLAFAQGSSSFPVARITSHLLTNVAVIRQFLARGLRCEGAEGEPGLVYVDA